MQPHLKIPANAKFQCKLQAWLIQWGLVPSQTGTHLVNGQALTVLSADRR